jgi:hypothetical protein
LGRRDGRSECVDADHQAASVDVDQSWEADTMSKFFSRTSPSAYVVDEQDSPALEYADSTAASTAGAQVCCDEPEPTHSLLVKLGSRGTALVPRTESARVTPRRRRNPSNQRVPGRALRSRHHDCATCRCSATSHHPSTYPQRACDCGSVFFTCLHLGGSALGMMFCTRLGWFAWMRFGAWCSVALSSVVSANSKPVLVHDVIAFLLPCCAIRTSMTTVGARFGLVRVHAPGGILHRWPSFRIQQVYQRRRATM